MSMFDGWRCILWIMSCSSFLHLTWFHCFTANYSKTGKKQFNSFGYMFSVKPLCGLPALENYKWIAPCCKPSVFTEGVSQLYAFTMTPFPEYSWLVSMLWRGFSSPRKGFYDQPLSSVVFQHLKFRIVIWPLQKFFFLILFIFFQPYDRIDISLDLTVIPPFNQVPAQPWNQLNVF